MKLTLTEVSLLQAQRLRPLLDTLLERYLIFGGMPHAVVEATEPSILRPSEEAANLLWSALLGDVGRGGWNVALWALG